MNVTTIPDATPARRRHPIALVAILGALALAGAVILVVALAGRHGSATIPAAANSPAASGTPATGSVDAATKKICDLNNTITDAVMQQGDAVRQIAEAASGSRDFDVRFEANMLGDTFDLADHARGGPSEFSTTMQTFSAHLNLATACLKAGWRAG